jgi:hypothetical protein
MKEKTLSWVLIWLHLLLLMGCATAHVEMDASPNPKIVSQVFSEVELTTAKGGALRGKLIRFEDQVLTLLPSPYWSVDSVRIPLDDIDFIKITDRKSSAGPAFLSGFGISFMVIGVLAGASSNYDEDYQAALAGAAVCGLVIGGVAALISLIVDAGHRTKFDFQKMPVSEKIGSLRLIMSADN